MISAAWSGAMFAQEDTTVKKGEPTEEGDTIRVGSIIIIKRGTNKSKDYDENDNNQTYKHRRYKKDNVNTNWFVVDFGYSGYNDQTSYNSQEAQEFIPNAGNPPVNKGDFAIRGARISNFNLWFFMQRRNIYKHVLNLKYGFGIENNNYYYKTPITYVDGGNPYVIRDSVSFSKNKLAADYFTVPIMININTNPNSRHGGLNLSFGISAGYLYSARQKQKSDERGKQKHKTDFNLESWKVAYIGELGLGPVNFYGSYSITPLHQYGVEQMPYNVGIRCSSW